MLGAVDTPRERFTVTNPDPDQELAKLIASKFIERRDAKAIQHSNGAYMPVTDGKDGPYVPWKLSDVVAHVAGRTTYGHYVVSAENTCRMFCFDIDLRDEWRDTWAGPTSERKKELAAELWSMVRILANPVKEVLNINPITTYSGCKGMHVYAPLDPGTPAKDAREMALTILGSFGDFFELEKGKNFFSSVIVPELTIEVFPKQEEVREGGLGNLIRLPFGVNQKSGKPGFAIKPGTRFHCSYEIDDPMLAMTKGSLR